MQSRISLQVQPNEGHLLEGAFPFLLLGIGEEGEEGTEVNDLNRND